MSDSRTSLSHGRSAAHVAAAGLCAGLVLLSAVAFAQDGKAGAPPDEPNMFERIGRWVDRQFSDIGTTFKGAGQQVETFGHEAGIAARTTVDNAGAAADAVARIPKARMVRGHEKCRQAPNGAPDCLAAAQQICRKDGFETGKSLDMTTAEVCPPRVYMSGRNSGPECRSETFVSSALCQ